MRALTTACAISLMLGSSSCLFTEASGGSGSGVSEWAACVKNDETVCVEEKVGTDTGEGSARAAFKTSCLDDADGDVGWPYDGNCPTSSKLGSCQSTCINASGSLETTGEVVPLKLVWYTSDANNAAVCTYQVGGSPSSCP